MIKGELLATASWIYDDKYPISLVNFSILNRLYVKWFKPIRLDILGNELSNVKQTLLDVKDRELGHFMDLLVVPNIEVQP